MRKPCVTGSCGFGIPGYALGMKILLSLIAALVVCVGSATAGEFSDMGLDDLKKAIAGKSVTLLDVNGSNSYAAGHIPGAIDFTAHKEDLASLLPADKNALIVAYCGNEHCGAYARAAQAAKQLGYTNVQHFKPGLAGWKSAGETLQK